MYEARDCTVVIYAEFEDVAIECGLWWKHECQMFMLANLAMLPDTRNYKLEWGEKPWVQLWKKHIHVYFHFFLSILPLIISAFNSHVILMGAVSLMLALHSWGMRMQCWQLDPMLLGKLTEGQRKPGMFFLQWNSQAFVCWSERCKNQQLDKHFRTHSASDLHTGIYIEILVVSCGHPLFLKCFFPSPNHRFNLFRVLYIPGHSWFKAANLLFPPLTC